MTLKLIRDVLAEQNPASSQVYAPEYANLFKQACCDCRNWISEGDDARRCRLYECLAITARMTPTRCGLAGSQFVKKEKAK